MKYCNEYLKRLENTLPDPCSVRDLINAGVYSNPTHAYFDRQRGNAPEFFQTGHRQRIKYPRDGVISWLRDRMVASNQKSNGGQGNGQILDF